MARPKRKPEDVAAVQATPQETADIVPIESPVAVRWTALGEKRRAWANGEMHAAGSEIIVSQRDAEILSQRGFAERI